MDASEVCLTRTEPVNQHSQRTAKALQNPAMMCHAQNPRSPSQSRKVKRSLVAVGPSVKEDLGPCAITQNVWGSWDFPWRSSVKGGRCLSSPSGRTPAAVRRLSLFLSSGRDLQDTAASTQAASGWGLGISGISGLFGVRRLRCGHAAVHKLKPQALGSV